MCARGPRETGDAELKANGWPGMLGTMSVETVAVIGGGPAGLSAASSLVAGGKRVTVLESAQVVGGKLRSDELDGLVVDVAVQMLSSTYGSLHALIEASGAARLLVRAPGRDALWRDGRPHALTYGSVATLVASGALPAGLKLRLAAKYLPFLAGRARALDANDPTGSGGVALDKTSIAEWGARELGDDFVELLAYPLLAAYYGSTPERTSAALYHALAKVGMEVRLYAAVGGMGALSTAIARTLEGKGCEVRVGAEVTSVTAVADGVALTVAGVEERFDAAVVAVPAPVARRLLRPEEALDGWLERVETRPSTTIALALDRPVKGDYFGLSFPRRSEPGKAVVAICVEGRKAAGLVPEARGLLVVFPSPDAADAAAGAAPEEAVEMVMPAVERAFPGVGETVTRGRVYHFEHGYTVFYPGYLRHLAKYDAYTLSSRLALAGDYLVAPTVEGAVVSGARAVKRILAVK